MGKKTKRHDMLSPCPVCGRRLRPCNMLRHVEAAHGDTPEGKALVAKLESERLSKLLGW